MDPQPGHSNLHVSGGGRPHCPRDPTCTHQYVQLVQLPRILDTASGTVAGTDVVLRSALLHMCTTRRGEVPRLKTTQRPIVLRARTGTADLEVAGG